MLLLFHPMPLYEGPHLLRVAVLTTLSVEYWQNQDPLDSYLVTYRAE